MMIENGAVIDYTKTPLVKQSPDQQTPFAVIEMLRMA